MKIKKYVAPAIKTEQEAWPYLLNNTSVKVGGNSGIGMGDGETPNTADSRAWDWGDDDDDF